MFYIYSLKSDTYYVGTTDNVQRRLEERNSKLYLNLYTSKGIPWKIKLSYLCKDSTEGYKLELFIKRMKSRKFTEKIIRDMKILDDICKNKL